MFKIFNASYCVKQLTILAMLINVSTDKKTMNRFGLTTEILTTFLHACCLQHANAHYITIFQYLCRKAVIRV